MKCGRIKGEEFREGRRLGEGSAIDCWVAPRARVVGG